MNLFSRNCVLEYNMSVVLAYRSVDIYRLLPRIKKIQITGGHDENFIF